MPIVSRSKVLVTGGSGLVGSAVAKKLRQNYEVLSPSRHDMDLLDSDSVRKYIENNRPDACVHAAAVVMGLGGNLNLPGASLFQNTQMDLNLFKALQTSKVSRVIYVSTVAGYGYPYLRQPLREEDFFKGAPHAGEYGYASSKRLAHAHAEALKSLTGANTSYLILTNIYGPNDRFNIQTGHVIPSLIAKASHASKRATSLEVWGNPDTVRDFVFSEDLGEAIASLLPLAHHGMLNISSGVGTQMQLVAETICHQFGLDVVDWQSNQPVGIPHRVVSNEALCGLIEFKPLNFVTGLEKTIEWYKQNPGRIRT